jgi:ferredoxin
MRVSVDPSKCTGHARCFAMAPAVYELDDDGYCAVDNKVVPPELEAEAERGAAACPERAITVDSGS